MSVTKTAWGTTKDGKQVNLYTLENSKGMKAVISDFGGILVRLLVPDAQGKCADVVLGYDDLASYEVNGSFFGCVVGPSANRIGGASFTIDGKEYHVAVNDNENNLHSDKEKGYHKQLFAAEVGTDSVKLSLKDADGNMGFPGNKCFAITYTLTENNELRLHYEAESDQNTILNPTNHTYFNLRGQGDPSIEDHIMQIKASHYTPGDAHLIPNGEIAKTSGTPFDFLAPKAISKEIDAENDQLSAGGGYDQNFVIDDFDGQLQQVAQVSAPGTSRVMKVFTTLPGIQFYSGNGIGEQTGKDGAKYGKRCGLALETQFFPDSIHKDNFPNAVFGPARKYASTTVYAFCN